MSYFNFGSKTTGNFDSNAGGSGFPPIPKGTDVKAIIEQAKWSQYGDDPQYIDLAWSVQDGPYKNRKFFQKVRTEQSDPVKAQKAMHMLGAIDANAKGNLRKCTGKPTDQELASALCFHPMYVKLDVWEITEDEFGQPLPEDKIKRGNWVRAVSSAKATDSVPQVIQKAAPVQPQPQPTDPEDLPF